MSSNLALCESPHPDEESDVPDLTAIHAVLHGDKDMFRILVHRHNPQLYRVGMAYLRNHAEAEDAMQNTYLKAFLNLRNFEGSAAFSTWLTRIMVNECLMILRRRKNRLIESVTVNEALPEQEDTARIPRDALRESEAKALLERAIHQLPQKHRTVYMMRDVQNLSTEETASCLSMSPANVKVSLHRARSALKTELLKEAGSLELFDYPAVYCNPKTEKVMAAIHALPPVKE